MLGLARALYGDPVFVVLDEPNSSLDDDGDKALTDAIFQRKNMGTTFVVMTAAAPVCLPSQTKCFCSETAECRCLARGMR